MKKFWGDSELALASILTAALALTLAIILIRGIRSDNDSMEAQLTMEKNTQVLIGLVEQSIVVGELFEEVDSWLNALEARLDALEAKPYNTPQFPPMFSGTGPFNTKCEGCSWFSYKGLGEIPCYDWSKEVYGE